MIYAFNGIQERTPLWDHLRKIADHTDGPWAMAGMMDHAPCLICSSNQVHKPKSVKYYNMWGASMEFMPLIKRCWSSIIQGTPLFRVTKNLKLLKPALKVLNREKFSDIENATAIKQSRVAELQGMIGKDPSNMFLVTEEFEASKDLRELIVARDSFLAQKSKIHWLQQGDTNSSYFHGMLKKKKEWK
ncbi:uncharacterized protein LOC141655465 [Silene latifolia]|uniref:uncharacterized protein LOC141655465 n=1 Tax=Silene latifolia TaxID=37657 RepID=UPI003D783304